MKVKELLEYQSFVTKRANPVYAYEDEDDPPWGSPPARTGTAESPPEIGRAHV